MSQHAENDRCARVLEMLEAWIDGDLDEAESKRVESHVHQCDSCQAELKLAETVVAELRALPVFDVPEHVMQAVRTKTRPRFKGNIGGFLQTFARRPAPVFAAAAAAVVVVLLVLSPWRRPPEPQYTDEEVARAVMETRLALAYVGSVAQRAEMRVKESVLHEGAAGQALRDVRRSIQVIGEAGAATADLSATPRTQTKGS